MIEFNQKNIFQDDIGIVQVISLSAKKNNAISWEVRVYQALYLIGYKLVLYQLGIDEEEMDAKFHGGNHVKAERRLLFNLCQDLEMKDQAALVEYVKYQLGIVPPFLMMESIFLHMMSLKKTDYLCNFVIDSLKKMEKADLLNNFIHDKCGDQNCEHHAVDDTNTDEYYDQGKGLCVIINQKIFKPDPLDPNASTLTDRLGTDKDRDALEVTFTLLEADCVIHNNLTDKELEEKLEQAALLANNPEYCWLSICVLSHGRRVNGVDEVLGVNGIGVDRKKVN